MKRQPIQLILPKGVSMEDLLELLGDNYFVDEVDKQLIPTFILYDRDESNHSIPRIHSIHSFRDEPGDW